MSAGHDVVRRKWLPLNHAARQPKRRVEAKSQPGNICVPEVRQLLTLPVVAIGQPLLLTSAATPLLAQATLTQVTVKMNGINTDLEGRAGELGFMK